MRKLALAVLALPLAAYTYFLNDAFTAGINGSNWQSNGTISGGTADGLLSAATNGGSVIYKNAISDPSFGTDAVYELKATLRITASGGTFVMYSRASMDALTGPATQGTYYAAEFTPTLTAGGCTMTANYYRRLSGTVHLLASQTQACRDGMTIRWAQRSGYAAISTSLNELYVLYDTALGAGRPGFGARGLPAGNGITAGSVGNLEYVAPGTISTSSVRTAIFDNRVDVEWGGVVDDAAGSGFLLYQVHRQGPGVGGPTVVMGNVRGGYFSDTTVTAGSAYVYTIYPHDVHLNFSSRAVSVTTSASGQKDPRKVGVRPLGTYWGASPENIDLQSGNLSFSLPTVTAMGRAGMAVPFRLSYNSQNWRKDPSGTWLLGMDVGFGFGWKMLAGSVAPVYSDWYTIHHYVYTDATGAEYDLDVNTSGVWTSKEGIYTSFDATKRRLYFPSGLFWEFDCIANGTEADAGTMYPTRLVDTNGNEIKLKYQGGLLYGGTNGSARVTSIEDVRAVNLGVSGYRSYSFAYNSDAIPHLTGISSHIPLDSSSFTFTYGGASALTEPFTNTGSFGSAVDLASMVVPGGSGLNFSMEYYAGSHELKKVTLPNLGTLSWDYGSKTLAGSRTMREVTSRVTNANDGEGNKTYTLYHDDTADLSNLVHAYTVVTDASGGADKAYFFNTAANWKLGLFIALNERALPSYASKQATYVDWLQSGNLNPYVYQRLNIVDAGTASETRSFLEQTIDNYGNLTQKKEYGHYGAAGSPPLSRTFTNSYLTGNANYTSRYIFNLLTSVTVQRPSEAAITLVSNTYDSYAGSTVPAVSNPSQLRQHDTANYGTSVVYRGNLTSRTQFGVTVTNLYDYTGTVTNSTDGYRTRTQTPSSTYNYAVPSATTAGSLGSSFTWNGGLQLTQASGPNGATGYASYDAYRRPSQTIAPNGQVINHTYGSDWSMATTGTRWTKTWVDGFGRNKKVETGYNSGGSPVTVSTVDTKYAPCACSPLGKLWKTSLPYAPGGTVRWTEYVYDALGRTVEVKQPASSGSTLYSYAGNVVQVSDPKGKWKKFETDAAGNLTKVVEPRPGGGADFETTYTYSVLGKLLTSTMTRPHPSTGVNYTQTRTWVYSAVTQRLTSVTHPESGTTAFVYNADGTPQQKTDAKGQRIVYSYDSDGRVLATQRYANASPGSEDLCGRVDYYYGSQTFAPAFTSNAVGRLAATATGTASGCSAMGMGTVIEMYSYNVAGAVTKKRLRMVRPSGTVDKDVSYGYTADGKLDSVLYPDETIAYHYTYDLMDRPTKMTGPRWSTSTTSIDVVKNVAYGAAGQITSMDYLQEVYEDNSIGGPFYIPRYLSETKTYNDLFQLTRQRTLTHNGAVAADIAYSFSATQNNGRIETRTNYVRNSPTGETVTYQYDALNRLTSASSNVGWTQSYGLDGFGNLWSQTMSGGTATPMSVSVDMTTSRINTTNWSYDANGNTTQMPTAGGVATLFYDIDNRLIHWTGPSGEVDQYGYLADNKRVWKKSPDGTETIYFYGAGGQKLATYTVQTYPYATPFTLTWRRDNLYFGGKLIWADGQVVVHDRLGSVVARGPSPQQHDYLPYGEEMGVAYSGDVNKFGTYQRDQTSGLDYADQRYFSGTLAGRFLTSDPYEASGGAGEPGSWNRAAYVGGDPVNFGDPSGLARCRVVASHGLFASVWCGSDDGSLGEYQWMLAPNPPPLPLDERGPWATAVTDFAASTWGANLDRMAEGRNGTTRTYRAASRSAINSLAPQCQVTFATTTTSWGSSVLEALSAAIDQVSFYNVNGAESNITYNQATGLDVIGNPTVGSAIGSYDAATLTVGPPGAELYLRHIVLGDGFLNATESVQSALLIHELLHVVVGSHENIFTLLNVTPGFAAANGGIDNPSLVLTNFIARGCPP